MVARRGRLRSCTSHYPARRSSRRQPSRCSTHMRPYHRLARSRPAGVANAPPAPSVGSNASPIEAECIDGVLAHGGESIMFRSCQSFPKRARPMSLSSRDYRGGRWTDPSERRRANLRRAGAASSRSLRVPFSASQRLSCPRVVQHVVLGFLYNIS